MTAQLKEFHLRMEQSTFDDLQRRADELDITVSEYLRKAVRVINLLEDTQKKHNGTVHITRDDGTEALLLIAW